MDEYLPRIVDAQLDVLIGGLPAISLDGPKGVGKTATALRRARTVWRLDAPGDRELIAADPTTLRDGLSPVLIDEWQRWPSVWDLVRRAVDDGAGPGTYLLTGSATPTDYIHSGAGRIVPIRMRPMTLVERGVGSPSVSLADILRGRDDIHGDSEVTFAHYVDEILRSGFPGIRRGGDERVVRATLDGYLERLFDHELVENGSLTRRPAAIRSWLTAYAASTASSTSYEKIRDAATGGRSEKLAKETTISYRDALQRLWILDPVEAWLPGHDHLSRLTVGPKLHLADPALAARLLSLTANSLIGPRSVDDNQPREGTMLGRLFESLVTLNVRVFAQAAEARTAHHRTRGGDHEIDLIVVGEAGRVVAIEVKVGAVPTDADVKHLNWLRHRIGSDLIDALIITTGQHAYRRPDGIAVVPAALLGP